MEHQNLKYSLYFALGARLEEQNYTLFKKKYSIRGLASSYYYYHSSVQFEWFFDNPKNKKCPHFNLTRPPFIWQGKTKLIILNRSFTCFEVQFWCGPFAIGIKRKYKTMQKQLFCTRFFLWSQTSEFNPELGLVWFAMNSKLYFPREMFPPSC